MNDVLCSFIIYGANKIGILPSSFQNSKSLAEIRKLNFEYVSGLEKVLAPIVLIHLREHNTTVEDINQVNMSMIRSEVFTCFANLALYCGSSNQSLYFLNHFITDNLAQIEWRMDFFDKLFEKVLPQLHKQFKGINIKNEFFLHGWMMAIFNNIQGLEGIEFSLRIWDMYLLHGEPILYCVALVILSVKLHKLNNAPM